MRVLLCLLVLAGPHFLNAQSFEKQMSKMLTAIEQRDKCEGLRCLPIIAERLQKAKEDAILAAGYKEIAILLWFSNYDDYTSLSAKDALHHSLMFHDSKNVRALLDSMNKPDHAPKYREGWSKLDSPWQAKITAKTANGKAYIVKDENTSSKLLCLKTDTGWIGSPLLGEGWEETEALAYLKDKTGKPQALLVEYGENSYGSGGGTTWHNAFLMNLHTLQTVYKQGTYYSEEVFCGKYGPVPDCVRNPCTIKKPLYIENNFLVIGAEEVTQKAAGYECYMEEATISFRGVYGDTPPNFENLHIPVEYTLPKPPSGPYMYEKGYLVRIR